MIRTIVVDDEKPSREVLCNYLKEYCNEVELVATAGSVSSAFKAIRKHHPDLVFLDIELGDGKGFDLLNMFEKVEFRVIFVTAYSEYAVKAFRFSAVDYLLKPVKIDELCEAVGKVVKPDNSYINSENISVLLRNIGNAPVPNPTLVIPNVRGFEVLRISDIIMCKADGYCTNFHLVSNRKMISSKNLKQYEDLLTENDFIRVHHSYLVNLNHVCSYTRQGEIILTEGVKASLGDAYKEAFTRRFGKR
jgi:two-component system, LytTR family, response regulator